MNLMLEGRYKCRNGQIAVITQIGMRNLLLPDGKRSYKFVSTKFFFAKVEEKKVYFDEEGKASSYLNTPMPDLDLEGEVV